MVKFQNSADGSHEITIVLGGARDDVCPVMAIDGEPRFNK